jgi:hypothetical protein
MKVRSAQAKSLEMCNSGGCACLGCDPGRHRPAQRGRPTTLPPVAWAPVPGRWPIEGDLKYATFVNRPPAHRNPFFWMSVIMWCLTVGIMVIRILNTTSLASFDPATVILGSDPFGSDFAQLHGISKLIRVERGCIAFLSFCVWLRLFKYMRSIPVFGTIGRTMTRAFPAVRPLLKACPGRWQAQYFTFLGGVLGRGTQRTEAFVTCYLPRCADITAPSHTTCTVSQHCFRGRVLSVEWWHAHLIVSWSALQSLC